MASAVPYIQHGSVQAGPAGKTGLGALFTPEPTKFPVVQGVRAIAAVVVAWCHLAAYGLPAGAQKSFVARSGQPGYLGVYCFFVLSGFIVPMAMHRAGYRLRDFRSFMLKRIIRVEPPYLVSIVVALVLLSLWGHGDRINPIEVALHIGYLIPFFQPKFDWISGVYWSLAVEFTYYITLALAFPLLLSLKRSTRISSCIGLAAICLSPFRPHHSLIESAPVFVLGIALMTFMAGISSRPEFLGVSAGATALATWSMGPAVCITALATMLFIGTVRRIPKVVLFLGDISYSTYLLHSITGTRVMHQALRFVPALFPGVLMAVGMAGSLVSAMVMYWCLEKPAKRWASRLTYRLATPTPS
jgi:peptidoglycan/LPS O-acetylase OafA/YrhL